MATRRTDETSILINGILRLQPNMFRPRHADTNLDLRKRCPVCQERLGETGWRLGRFVLDGVTRTGIACVAHLL
jgi:ribosomal protein L44E